MRAWAKLPEALREIRTTKGWTQRQLAERAGVGVAAIQNYETGKCAPRLDTLESLLKALASSPQELVGIMMLCQALPSTPKKARVRPMQPAKPFLDLGQAQISLNRFLHHLVATVPARATED